MHERTCVCRCKTGFAGRHCEDGPHPCIVANPCQNGGTCYDDKGEAKCRCTEREYKVWAHLVYFVLPTFYYLFGSDNVKK